MNNFNQSSSLVKLRINNSNPIQTSSALARRGLIELGLSKNEDFLQSTSFDTVQVNLQGQIISQILREAHYFTEEVNGLTIDLVFIPKGNFLMGSPDSEKSRWFPEGPQHLETLHSLFLAKYPITQAQWRAIALLPKVNHHLQPEPSHFKGDLLPVENIAWYEAVEFCDRLARHTGRDYRLPSEAEWEYACRAGTTTPFHFGETITSDLANYNANYTYGEEETGLYRRGTTSVKEFPFPNAFGLFDMHGNVYEFCSDLWQVYPGFPHRIGSDSYSEIHHPDVGYSYQKQSYVIRGGSWFRSPTYLRSARRPRNVPLKSSYLGFRIACSAEEKKPKKVESNH